MEIFELRYFLGVAKHENIHRASEQLHISPASLSKAIQRLEDELSVSLFTREGRNIKLTEHGRVFQNRAAEIVHLEESARLELAGHKGQIHIVFSGPEVLLSEYGTVLSTDLKKKFPLSSFEFYNLDDDAAIKSIERGESHLTLVTQDPPHQKEIKSKIIAEPQFKTVVGKNHPLYKYAKGKKIIPVDRVLEFPFASPNRAFLGQVHAKQSLDGWRDDKFPRRIEYLTSSLKLLEELAANGSALAYLPEYYVKKIDVEPLLISGCPYTCSQRVRLLCKNPKNTSWLNQWF